MLSAIFFSKSIKLGIIIFKTTQEFVNSNPEIYALPLISTIVTILWVAFWLSSAVFIFAVGTPKPRDDYPFLTKV
jgi:Plasma-membrane choline transporter